MEHRNECHNNIKNKQDTQPKEDSFHNSIPDTKQSVSELTLLLHKTGLNLIKQLSLADPDNATTRFVPLNWHS
jgi:hypothetical protein